MSSLNTLLALDVDLYLSLSLSHSLVAYYDQYNEFDYFITSPELPNPWQTDSTEMWDTEKNR